MTDDLARHILDNAATAQEIIDREVARRVTEDLRPVQKLLHDITRELNKAQNHLTARIVGYERGSLPPKE